MSDDLKTRLRTTTLHDGEWESGLPLEALARIEELEAKLATCKKYSAAYLEMDRITREALCRTEDKLAQADAMVAAALGKAADLIAGYENHRSWAEWASLHANIRALITDDAQTALTKLLAAAERQMLQEALEVCDQRAALLRDQDDLNDWYRGAELCAQDVSAMLVQREQKAARAGAIQKEGGA